MKRMHSRTQLVLLPIVAIVVALLVSELLLRAWFNLFPPLNYMLLPASKAGLHLFEPSATGAFYAVKPNYRQTFLRHEFRVDVQTNNLGFRENRDYLDEAVDIAFIGDSYTFGWGVEAGERYSDIVARSFPDLNVLSYSYANGNAPVYYLPFLQKRPQLMPKVLVLGLFAFNDLAGDMSDAVVETQEGRIERIGSRTLKVGPYGSIVSKAYQPPDFPSVDWFTLHTAVGRTIKATMKRGSAVKEQSAKPGKFRPLDRGDWDTTALEALEYVQRINELALSAGSTLLVFYIPFPSYINDYPVCLYDTDLCAIQRRTNALGEALADWSVSNDIHFIDPVERFRELEAQGTPLYFSYDAHWTPAGHRAAGQLIARYLEEHELLKH